MGAIKIGDKVQAAVFVGNKRIPTHTGIVVNKNKDGSICDVDIMGLHGGAPWIKKEATHHLRGIDCAVCDGEGYEMCWLCRGSGEGMVDGSACKKCRGTGRQRCECVLEPDDKGRAGDD